MKKTFLFTTLMTVLLLPAAGIAVQHPLQQGAIPPQQVKIPIPQLPAQQQSCKNPIEIIPTAVNKPTIIGDIQSKLDDYQSYAANGYYEICFKMTDPLVINDLFNFTKPLTITVKAGETKDIHIIGLKIKRDDNLSYSGELLHVTNDIPAVTVHLYGLQLSNVIDGISLDGTGKIVVGTYAGSQAIPKTQTIITGDANKSGACLHVKSTGAVIQGADISSCGEGVLIEADDALIGAADKDHVVADMNDIHDNAIGIHDISGKRNKFAYNLVHDNKQQQAARGEAKDAILIEQGANEDLAALVLELFDNGDGTKYALQCTKDKDGNVIQRQIQFQAPQQSGVVSLYSTDENYHQANKYLTACDLDAQGLCILKDLPPDVMSLIQPGDCGIKNYYMTALFTGTSSTEFLASSFEFNTHISSVVANPVEVPGSVAGAVPPSSASDIVDEADDSGSSSSTVVANMGDSGGGMNAAASGISKCSLIEGAGYRPAATSDVICIVAGLAGLLLLKRKRLRKALIPIRRTPRSSSNRSQPRA